MAMAHPPSDAAPVPVTWRSGVLPGVLGLLLAATTGTQQSVLPHGLRAGRHDVAARLVGPGGSSSLWYPALCGRRPTAPATPCRDAPPDTGRFPLLILVWKDRLAAATDTATAAYLASHGFVVVAGSEASAAGLRALPFVDTTRIARAQLRPADALLVAAAGGWQLTVALPPGPSDHIRLSATVTRAFLDAALRTAPATLPDLARRLRAAGLTARLAPAGR